MSTENNQPTVEKIFDQICKTINNQVPPELHSLDAYRNHVADNLYTRAYQTTNNDGENILVFLWRWTPAARRGDDWAKIEITRNFSAVKLYEALVTCYDYLHDKFQCKEDANSKPTKPGQQAVCTDGLLSILSDLEDLVVEEIKQGKGEKDA